MEQRAIGSTAVDHIEQRQRRAGRLRVRLTVERRGAEHDRRSDGQNVRLVLKFSNFGRGRGNGLARSSAGPPQGAGAASPGRPGRAGAAVDRYARSTPQIASKTD
jgi:hypothetical protein